MKNIKKSLTRDDVIKNGEYIGFTEYESGATEQRWLIDGLVFAETCTADGRRVGFRCMGKASKVLKQAEAEEVEFAKEDDTMATENDGTITCEVYEDGAGYLWLYTIKGEEVTYACCYSPLEAYEAACSYVGILDQCLDPVNDGWDCGSIVDDMLAEDPTMTLGKLYEREAGRMIASGNLGAGYCDPAYTAASLDTVSLGNAGREFCETVDPSLKEDDE